MSLGSATCYAADVFLSDEEKKSRRKKNIVLECLIQRRRRWIYLDLQGKRHCTLSHETRKMNRHYRLILFVSAIDFSHLSHHPIQLIIACHLTQEIQQKQKMHLLLFFLSCPHCPLPPLSSCRSDSRSLLRFLHLRHFTSI